MANEDDVLTFLEDVGRKLNAIKAQAEGFGKGNSDRFTDSLNNTSRSLINISSVMSGMGKNLLGPLGLAAGFVAVAKAMEDFSVGQVQVRALAINTGFAVSNVQDMQQAMRRMGLSAQEANNIIATFGSKMQNLAAFKEGSELWESLTRSTGGATLANNLKQLALANDQMGALNEVIRTFSHQTREAKIALSQYFGIPINVLEDYSQAAKRGIEIWRENSEEAQKYHDLWVDYEIRLDNIYRRVSNHFIEAFSKITEALAKNGVDETAIVEWINNQVDRTLAHVKGTIDDIILISNKLTEIKERWQNPRKAHTKESWATAMKERSEKIQAERYMTEDFDMKEALEKSSDKKKPVNAAREISKLRHEGQESPKKETNKLLEDTRGILQRMWDKIIGAPARWTGGSVTAGDVYKVGERGPEVLFSSNGAYQLVGVGGPEIVRPTMAGQVWSSAKALVSGGLVGLAEQQGYTLPGWVKKSAGFFRNEEAQTAFGFMHGGAGAVLRKMRSSDMMFDAAIAAPSEMSRAQSFFDRMSRPSVVSESKSIWDNPRAFSAEMTGGASVFGPSSYQFGIEGIRSNIDRSLGGMEINGATNLAAEISFNNVWPGVETIANADGLDTFKVNKTRQLAVGGY